MSCRRPLYVCLPDGCNCDCQNDQEDCGCGSILPGDCGGNQESLDKIIELLTDIKKCVCDCGGWNPEPGYKGKAIGVILPESGRKSGTSLFRVDKDIENVDFVAADYFNKHPLWSGIVSEEIDGQAMIKIPAFAYKRGVADSGSNEGKKYLLLAPADTKESGFERHPAFMKDGQPIDCFWVGAYQACADPADATKLGSVAGTLPLANINQPSMRIRALARNTGAVSGFMMWSLYQFAAIQMLYLVEYADVDAQTVIGTGNSSGGGIRKVDDALVATSNYRGIIGLWGNVWQMLEGVRTDGSRKTEIWKRDGTQSYVTTTVVLPVASMPNGAYMTSMETSSGAEYSFNDVFLPDKISGNAADSMYADTFFEPTLNAVFLSGGPYSRGSQNGMFTCAPNRENTFVASSFGTRIAKI